MYGVRKGGTRMKHYESVTVNGNLECTIENRVEAYVRTRHISINEYAGLVRLVSVVPHLELRDRYLAIIEVDDGQTDDDEITSVQESADEQLKDMKDAIQEQLDNGN